MLQRTTSLPNETWPYCGIDDDGVIVRYGGPRKDRHRMYFGPSGSGKDTSHAIVDLLLTKAPMIVFDPAGEALAVTGRWRESLGFVKVIDPMGVMAEMAGLPGFKHLKRFKSIGFDPMRRLKTKRRLATEVAKNSEVCFPMESDGRFWVLRSRQLLNCLQMYEWLEAQRLGRPARMINVMDMLTLPHGHPEEHKPNIVTLQKLMVDIAKHPYRPMARLAPSFIKPSEQLESVLATAISVCTSLISDEQIIDDMEGGEQVNWQELKDNPEDNLGTYFIVLPGNEFETHGVWLRLVLGDCLDALSKTRPGSHRVGIKLNEVGHLRRIDALKRAQGMIRKNGVWLDTYWQDMNQVEEIYTPAGARSFWSNSGVKSTWGTDDPETMRIFSMRAGIRSTELDSYHTNQKSDDKNRSVTGLNVLNPDDVSALEDCTTYNFFHKVRNVVKLKTPHYTEIPECRGRFDPNPYHMAV